MGAERLVQFDTAETATKVTAFLKPLEGGLGVEGKYGCWIEWDDPKGEYSYGPNVLEIGYSAGWDNYVVACLIARELTLRFKVIAIGHCDGGLFHDTEVWDKEATSDDRDNPRKVWNRYGKNFGSWTEWIKHYTPTFERDYHIQTEDYPPFVQEVKDMEAFVVAKFKELDARFDMNTVACPCGAWLRIPDGVPVSRVASVEYLRGEKWKAEFLGDNAIQVACPNCPLEPAGSGEK